MRVNSLVTCVVDYPGTVIGKKTKPNRKHARASIIFDWITMKKKIIEHYGLRHDKFGDSGEDIPEKDLLRIAMVNFTLTLEDGVPAQIPSCGHMCIGSIGSAYNLENMEKAGITHVLCLSDVIRLKYPDKFTYLRIPMVDKPNYNMLDDMPAIYDFIDSARDYRYLPEKKPNRREWDEIENSDNEDVNDSAKANSGCSGTLGITSRSEMGSRCAEGGCGRSGGCAARTKAITGETGVVSSANVTGSAKGDGIDSIKGADYDNLPQTDTITGASDEEQLKCGKVLVHCYQGKSRSSAVCCAYLMVRYGLSLDAALEKVCEVRPIAAPNSGFMSALRKLEKQQLKRNDCEEHCEVEVEAIRERSTVDNNPQSSVQQESEHKEEYVVSPNVQGGSSCGCS